MDDAAPRWRIGETLPWVVPWTGEDAFRLEPSSAFPGMMELVQDERPGEGEPLPSGMNMMRQRRGVTQLLCHVCGAPTPPDDRFLFPVSTGAFLKLKGGARYASHLPPVHGACAQKAGRLCPHLRATFATPVPFPRELGVIGPERSLPDSLKRFEGRLPTDVPIAFAYYRVFGEGFTRVVRRLRAEAA